MLKNAFGSNLKKLKEKSTRKFLREIFSFNEVVIRLETVQSILSWHAGHWEFHITFQWKVFTKSG